VIAPSNFHVGSQKTVKMQDIQENISESDSIAAKTYKLGSNKQQQQPDMAVSDSQGHFIINKNAEQANSVAIPSKEMVAYTGSVGGNTPIDAAKAS